MDEVFGSSELTRSPCLPRFFVEGYKTKAMGGTILTFGWELVILLRKMTLILAAKFTTVRGDQSFAGFEGYLRRRIAGWVCLRSGFLQRPHWSVWKH